ncbi:MAG: ASKHA domain-containing protein [Thermodesulfobacteriota bacterium]
MATPLVETVAVTAAPPSLGDNTGDVDRLKRALPAGTAVVVPFGRLAKVGARFRAAGFAGAAVVNRLAGGAELVDFLPAMPERLPAMALDLGTTHLEATLIDLATGARLASATRPNSQAEHGADILSRIHFAAKGEGLHALQQAVAADINGLASTLAAQAGMAPEAIRALSVAGNTTMVHLFLGLDPYHLCREPYIPLVNAPDPCHGADLGLAIHPAAPVWVLPSIGSYFGGDLIAGIVASNLDQEATTSMLIDVGTNAEVVVGNREWLIACAGAAGPALEGGVARMGMRAGPGAIDQVAVDPETRAIRYRTIGEEKPRGLCGSGIIDLVAGLYLARMIDIRGKFRPAAMGERLVAGADGPALVVAPAAEAAGGQPVLLSQVDLDALMRSKAAMYSILTTLMNQVGMPFSALHRIFVAGAFGRHIAPRQAIVLGMLPDLPLETYQAIGNSSLAGAELVLADGEARSRALGLVRRITYLELNVNQEFMIRFSGSRFIPHTDHHLFPSVPFYNEE